MFGSRGFSPYGTYALGNSVKSGINWSNLLSNTQKTLSVINQAIPAFYQIKPIFSNMKTMFKVVNEINRDNTKSSKNTNNNYNSNSIVKNDEKENINSNNNQDNNVLSIEDGPMFFV